MNILILTPKVPWPPVDGGSIATASLAEGLAERGNKITVLAINTPKHFADAAAVSSFNKPGIHLISCFVNTGIKPLRALLNLLFSELPYNGIRFYNREYKKKLSDLLQQNKFDIVQLEGLYMALYVPAIRSISQAKIVMRAHNVEHEIWERTAMQTNNIFKRWYYRILTGRIRNFDVQNLKSYDALLPITQRDTDKFREMGCQLPVMVAPAGIDFNRLNGQNLKSSLPDLFFIGALDWGPNQEGLCWFLDNCWPSILESKPTLIFHVAGRNAPDWLVKRLALKGIQYHGEVKNAYTYMAGHRVMIVPLLSGGGMRIKIIEGMALGKAIVSTPLGAEGIGVKDNQNIMLGKTPEEISSKVISLLSDDQLFEKISSVASEFVREKFDNLQISGSLQEFYKTLVS